MRRLHLLAMSVALMALSATAQAGPRGVGGGFRHLPPPPPPLFHGGFIGFPVWGVEREVHVIEREVIREVPVPVVVEPPPPPRKPYKLGASYDSLPTPCMKMIEDGASYYHCSGEWYRQIGSGSAVTYRAVKKAAF